MSINLQATQGLFQRRKLFLCQIHICGIQILDNPLLILGAGDRNHVRILMEHPGRRDLGRRRTLFGGEVFLVYAKEPTNAADKFIQAVKAIVSENQSSSSI